MPARDAKVFCACGLGSSSSGGLYPPIMENQMEKKMENEMETKGI